MQKTKKNLKEGKAEKILKLLVEFIWFVFVIENKEKIRLKVIMYTMIFIKKTKKTQSNE
jgi:hypothetical protein